MGYEAGVAYLFWMSIAVAVFVITGFIYACIPAKPEKRVGKADSEATAQRRRRRIRHDQPAIRR